MQEPEPQSGDRSGPARAAEVLARKPDLWYHTIELAPGVVTPGYIDLRGAAPKVLPESLAGMSVLEVGTFDGFWAFEMERRGAEVVTADLGRITDADWPPMHRARLEARAEEDGLVLGEGFELAAEALGSAVRRIVCDIYELGPESAGGPYDLVFIGAILSHLRDPVSGLLNARSVLRPGGELRIFEPISAQLSLRSKGRPAAEFRATSTDYTWWLPNTAALVEWLVAAGFDDVQRYTLDRPPCAERTWYAGVRGTAPPRS